MRWTILKVLTLMALVRKKVAALIRRNKVSIDGEFIRNEKALVVSPEELFLLMRLFV